MKNSKEDTYLHIVIHNPIYFYIKIANVESADI